jgi:endonuclease YncB( thermonuclease family)
MKIRTLFIVFSLIFLLVVPSVYAQSVFKVLKVVDGDTISVDVRGKKEVVRLLGIDTPESVDPRKPVQCFAKEATNKLKTFIDGKSVILVDDSTQGNRDKYGRLLRYVYLSDNVRTFVNGEMIKQGYAFSYKQYPTKMLDRFNSFEKYAREHNLGLWGACSSDEMTSKASTKKSANLNTQKTDNVTDTEVSGRFTCSGKTKCGQMTNCAEAQFYLNSCGISRLDGDKDGVPCETLCN